MSELGTENQPFTPPNKDLYDNLIVQLAANARDSSSVMKQFRDELLPDMSNAEVLETAIEESI